MDAKDASSELNKPVHKDLEQFELEWDLIGLSQDMEIDPESGLTSTSLDMRAFANHCINQYLNIRFSSEASMVVDGPSADASSATALERALARLSVS